MISTAITCSMSMGLVQISMTMAPKPMTKLRKPIEKEDPTTVCTSVVSLVRRESTSPDWVVSKKDGLWRSTWRYTALRTSVVMRSPSQLTV